MHVCAEHAEGSSHRGEGIELTSASAATSRAHSPKIGSEYTVVHVRPSDTGTEATAASTDGALTIGEREMDEEGEVDEELGPGAEGVSLLQERAAPGKRLVCPLCSSARFQCIPSPGDVVMPGSFMHHRSPGTTLPRRVWMT